MIEDTLVRLALIGVGDYLQLCQRVKDSANNGMFQQRRQLNAVLIMPGLA